MVSKTLIALILGLSLMLGVVGVRGAGTAQASSSRTFVYTCGMGGSWGCPRIEPGEIVFGAHYAVAGLHWSSWAGNGATGTAKHFWRGVGSSGYYAHVALYNVKTHNGRRYFSWIRISANHHKTRYLQYSSGRWHTR